MKFKEMLESNILSNVESYIKKELHIVNMEYKLEKNVIKFYGWMSKTGSSFDNFCTDLQNKYNKKFNFIEWKNEIAYFEIKI